MVVSMAVIACARRAPEAAAQPAPAAPPESPVPPQLAPLHWSTVAELGAGALVMVEQKAASAGRCKVRCTEGNRELWSMEACVATRADWRFLSADGSGLLVVHVSPSIDDRRPAEVPLVDLYRAGAFARTFRAGDLFGDPSSLRVEAGRLMWVSLAQDPRVLAAGVELSLSDGRRTVLPFTADAQGAPAPRPVVVPAAKSAGTCPNPCAYTDDAGTYHLVESLDEIPAKYRARAAALRSDSIQIVSGSPAPPTGPSVSPTTGRSAEQSRLPRLPGMDTSPKAIQRETENRMREAMEQEKNNYPANHIERVRRLLDPTPGPDGKRMNPSDFDAKSQ
jgi:hypothetical protein